MKGKRRKEFRVSAGEESACESIAWKAESYSSIWINEWMSEWVNERTYFIFFFLNLKFKYYNNNKKKNDNINLVFKR